MTDNSNITSPTSSTQSTTSIPLARIKKIIKCDDRIGSCSRQSIDFVNTATILFIEDLLRASSQNTKAGKRKTINVDDIKKVARDNPVFWFLKDVI